jgi:hypothetical protein
MWTQTNENVLRESDHYAISKGEFAQMLASLYSTMQTLVDTFAHCGLYPLDNPCKPDEYAVSHIFKEVDAAPILPIRAAPGTIKMAARSSTVVLALARRRRF